jgi:antitoxin component YwqK of YwqJK toxin-antitoxin module
LLDYEFFRLINPYLDEKDRFSRKSYKRLVNRINKANEGIYKKLIFNKSRVLRIILVVGKINGRQYIFYGDAETHTKSLNGLAVMVFTDGLEVQYGNFSKDIGEETIRIVYKNGKVKQQECISVE